MNVSRLLQDFLIEKKRHYKEKKENFSLSLCGNLRIPPPPS